MTEQEGASGGVRGWYRSMVFVGLGVLVLVVAGVATWTMRDRGDNGAAQQENGELPPGGPELVGLEVSSGEFIERYNAAVVQRGAGEAFGELSWRADDRVGAEVASQAIGEWGMLELYRDTDDAVSGFIVVGNPETPELETHLLASAQAAIAAVLDATLEEADSILSGDLRAGDPEARPLQEAIERDGVALHLTWTDGTWQLTITSTGIWQ